MHREMKSLLHHDVENMKIDLKKQKKNPNFSKTLLYFRSVKTTTKKIIYILLFN